MVSNRCGAVLAVDLELRLWAPCCHTTDTVRAAAASLKPAPKNDGPAANGDFALIFDLPRDNPRRAVFYQNLTGMDVARVNSHWARLMFSAQSVPTEAMPDEAAMATILRRNPSAVGWLSKEPTDAGLRTLLILKEAPGK